MYTRKQKIKQLIIMPIRSMSEELLELMNDRLQKTEQALFQFKLDLEKDPTSKLPSDLLSIVDEICGQLPRMPTTSSRKIAQRLQPMLQTLDEIIKSLAAVNPDSTNGDKQFANKAVKRYRQVQNIRKVL